MEFVYVKSILSELYYVVICKLMYFCFYLKVYKSV